MAYQANIPQPTDLLSQSQSDLLNNFQALQTLIDVNHVDFASGDQGKHKWVTFPVQGAIPPAGSGFAGGELGLYNAVFPLNSQSELYINKTNQVTVTQIPTTASVLSVNSAPAAISAGYSYLPSGIILRWGSVTGATGTNTQTLGSNPNGGPAFTQVISVQLTPYSATPGDVDFAVRLISATANTFTVYVSNRTTTGPATGGYIFLAIGY